MLIEGFLKKMVCQNCGSESHRKNNSRCSNYSDYLKELEERKSQKKDDNMMMDEDEQNTSKKRQNQQEISENPAKKPTTVFELRLRSLSTAYLDKKIPSSSSDEGSEKEEENEDGKNSKKSGENAGILKAGEAEKQGEHVEKGESWDDYLDRMHAIDLKIIAENKEPEENEWYMKFLEDNEKNVDSHELVEDEWYMKFLDEQ